MPHTGKKKIKKTKKKHKTSYFCCPIQVNNRVQNPPKKGKEFIDYEVQNTTKYNTIQQEHKAKVEY
jgi:hypothetical protein